jgi:GntR family transcriptional regulator/MocR family aminotransferase
VRGVVGDASRVVVTSGWAQGRTLLLRALKAGGAKRVAIEDPCFVDAWEAVKRIGLELIPIPVDEHGLSIDALEQSRADAVIVTPAHQYPSGAVLSGERRAALLAWLRRTDATVVEDDYDAEYRYDRAPIGALQGLDPARIVYAGTASKTLAPALRLGWLVVPERLLEKVRVEQTFSDFGAPRIEQHTFAEFLGRGDLDRHLRRMRARYRARRDALVTAVERWIPAAEICGVAAGLHAVLQLPDGVAEKAVLRAAEREGSACNVMGAYEIERRKRAGALILGYARNGEAVIEAGVRELAGVLARRKP